MRLIQQKKTWMPTAQGWLLTLVFFITLISFGVTHVHPFLAPFQPIKAEVLAVEGWLPDYALKAAIIEFKKGKYQKLITTGVPLERGFYLAQYKTYAELAAATLLALDFEQDNLIAIPAQNVTKNRTSASAIALNQWMKTSDLNIKSINLLTLDVHARRSWLVFKQALAPEIKVGVIAVASDEYNPKRWWAYSGGVRSIMSEGISYIYARFINWKT